MINGRSPVKPERNCYSIKIFRLIFEYSWPYAGRITMSGTHLEKEINEQVGQLEERNSICKDLCKAGQDLKARCGPARKFEHSSSHEI